MPRNSFKNNVQATAKAGSLPNREWLTLCEAITSLAIDQAMDRTAVRSMFARGRANLAELMDRCFEEAHRDRRYEGFPRELPVSSSDPFSLVRKLEKCRQFWPRSGKKLFTAAQENADWTSKTWKKFDEACKFLANAAYAGRILLRGVKQTDFTGLVIPIHGLYFRQSRPRTIQWTENTILPGPSATLVEEAWTDVHVGREGLMKVLRETKESKINSRQRGRSPAYDWPLFDQKVRRIIDDEGTIDRTVDPSWTHSELERRMVDWCEKRWGKVPVHSTLRKRIRQVLDKID